MSESLSLFWLRRNLERIESRQKVATALFAFGHEGIDRTLGGGLVRGRLHEIFASEEDVGNGAGFVALLGVLAGEQQRPTLWLRTDRAERHTGRLHATGLGEHGLDPAALLLGLVPDETALLRAAADAARCGGLGAILIECWGTMHGLDLTATRRLMLAAEASGVTLLLLRIAAEPVPSAADTRWRVNAASSVSLEANAPGAPMFDLELLRRRAGPPAGPWRVEWDRDRRCFRDPAQDRPGRDKPRTTGPGAALPRLVPPMAAGGTTAADSAAAFRRTG